MKLFNKDKKSPPPPSPPRRSSSISPSNSALTASTAASSSRGSFFGKKAKSTDKNSSSKNFVVSQFDSSIEVEPEPEPVAISPKKSKKKSKKNVTQLEQTPTRKKKRCCGMVGTLLTLSLLGGAGYAIWRYALGSPTTLSAARQGFGDFTNVLKDGLQGLDFGKFFGNDPQAGDSTMYTWQSEYIQPNNGGLHLTLLNALDDTWQDEFYDAVGDWSNSPALSLELEKVEVDYDCNRVDGVMLVCNGNFGDTGWVGINQNEIKRDMIVSSVTKMNEFYLRNADYEHRRYTMCHEVGHGFGLPHTDEDPYNQNQGNCLDYTKEPAENMYPGGVNLSKLKNMYLSRRKLTGVEGKDGSFLETHMLVVDPDLIEDIDEYDEV